MCQQTPNLSGQKNIPQKTIKSRQVMKLYDFKNFRPSFSKIELLSASKPE